MTPAGTPVGLISLATASPPHDVSQEEVAETARVLLSGRYPDFERLAPVFANAGIERRQLARPLDWYVASLGWPERSAAYLDAAVALFIDAASGALAAAGLKGCDIDMVVTASSTGIATPSLEARALQAMGFRSDIVRAPVFGLGCAGGAAGLALAARLARSEPGARVLFVTVELCSLSMRGDDVTKADVVAAALFGDGAAACVLRTGEDGFAQIVGAADHTWPDTLDIMGWDVERQGLGVVFAQAIPRFARAQLRPAMDEMLKRQGLSRGGVDRFICHPGGAKVIEALETALEIGQGGLDHERAVLADHGNMSAPTVLFVLDRVRQTGLPARSSLLALGPGFTASTVTLAA